MISGDQIFLCGGKSYEECSVSNYSYIFNIPDENFEVQSSKLKGKLKKKINRFEKLPKMNHCRYSHMGILFNETGCIYIFGGRNEKK